MENTKLPFHTLLSKLLVFVIYFNALVTTAQEVTYGYDSAGNRIRREIVLNTRQLQRAMAGESGFVSESLSGKAIRIYPNPTKGMLKVEICDYTESDFADFSIYDLSGRQLNKLQSQGSMTEIDMSSYPEGVYILLIQFDEKKSSWKIIKE